MLGVKWQQMQASAYRQLTDKQLDEQTNQAHDCMLSSLRTAAAADFRDESLYANYARATETYYRLEAERYRRIAEKAEARANKN